MCYATPMVALAKRQPRMSVSEFLVWDSGDFVRYELVDGEPRAMPPTGNIHGLLQSELGRRIGNHLRAHRPHGDVIANPGVIPHLLSAHNFRIADLGVTCAGIVPGASALPEPILLVEILSPRNASQTWSNVWTYTSLPSLQEILILHSDRVAAELLRRAPTGAWPTEPQLFHDGTLHLASLDLPLPLAHLYARTALTP